MNTEGTNTMTSGTPSGLGTLIVMAASLISGISAGLNEFFNGTLQALNKNLTPVTATVLGMVLAAIITTVGRELFGLLRWWVERRDRLKVSRADANV